MWGLRISWRRTSRWQTRSAMKRPLANVLLARSRCQWCLQPSPPHWQHPRTSRLDLATGQCGCSGSCDSGHLDRRAAVGLGDVTASRANHQAPAAGPEGKGRASFSRSGFITTRIAITNGSSDVIHSPSRLILLQPAGPGCHAAGAGLCWQRTCG